MWGEGTGGDGGWGFGGRGGGGGLTEGRGIVEVGAAWCGEEGGIGEGGIWVWGGVGEGDGGIGATAVRGAGAGLREGASGAFLRGGEGLLLKLLLLLVFLEELLEGFLCIGAGACGAARIGGIECGEGLEEAPLSGGEVLELWGDGGRGRCDGGEGWGGGGGGIDLLLEGSIEVVEGFEDIFVERGLVTVRVVGGGVGELLEPRAEGFGLFGGEEIVGEEFVDFLFGLLDEGGESWGWGRRIEALKEGGGEEEREGEGEECEWEEEADVFGTIGGEGGGVEGWQSPGGGAGEVCGEEEAAGMGGGI